jgi:hypothetical protein
MPSRDLGTAAAAVNLLQCLCERQFQLRGIPSVCELFGALLPPRNLQTEALKAQCARRFEQLLVVESVPRFLRPTPGAKRLDAPRDARRWRSLTTPWRFRSVEIALLFFSLRMGAPAHVSSPRTHQTARCMPTGQRFASRGWSDT